MCYSLNHSQGGRRLTHVLSSLPIFLTRTTNHHLSICPWREAWCTVYGITIMWGFVYWGICLKHEIYYELKADKKAEPKIICLLSRQNASLTNRFYDFALQYLSGRPSLVAITRFWIIINRKLLAVGWEDLRQPLSVRWHPCLYSMNAPSIKPSHRTNSLYSPTHYLLIVFLNIKTTSSGKSHIIQLFMYLSCIFYVCLFSSDTVCTVNTKLEIS